jgi:hypothetical protein
MHSVVTRYALRNKLPRLTTTTELISHLKARPIKSSGKIALSMACVKMIVCARPSNRAADISSAVRRPNLSTLTPNIGVRNTDSKFGMLCSLYKTRHNKT